MGTNEAPIISALPYIGNAEVNCALQLLVNPGEEVSAADLNTRFATAQTGASTVIYNSPLHLAQIVTQRHIPAGAFSTNNAPGYMEWRGTKTADPQLTDSLAGHMLGVSAHYGVSLQQLWSKHSLNPNVTVQGPAVRSWLFLSLAASKEGQAVSGEQLRMATSVAPGIVNDHLNHLYEKGFINYAAIPLTSYLARFVPTEALVHTWPARRQGECEHTVLPSAGSRLSGFLASSNIESFTYQEIGNMLAAAGKAMSPDTLKEAILQMLREGSLRSLPLPQPILKEGSSEIRLNQEQRKIITRCANIIEGLATEKPRTIQAGLRIGRAVLRNKALTTQILRRGYAASFASRRLIPHRQRHTIP